MLGVNVSPVGEAFKLVHGFWVIADALNSCWNGVRVNKFKAKRVAGRRNVVMKEIQRLPADSQSQAKDRLASFDKDFIELLEKFNKNSFVFKMLFRKSDHDMFEVLFEDLEKIRQIFSRQSVDLNKIRIENSQDILDDFRNDKEILKSNIDEISPTDKVEIKSNFVEFKNIVKVAAETISLSGELDTSINLQDISTVSEEVEGIQLILDDVTSVTSAVVSNIKPLKSITPSSSESTVFRARAITSAAQLQEYTQYWENWFQSYVSSIKPSKRIVYASMLYEEDVTNEDRLIKRLLKNSNWLMEHKCSEDDSDDIIKYLENAGRFSLSSPISPVVNPPHVATARKPLAPIELSQKLIDLARIGNINDLQALVDSCDVNNIINNKDNIGYTALIWASNEGHEAIVKILINQRANMNKKDNHDDTALILASANGHEAIVKILIDNCAIVNEKNHDGNTALILASDKGHESIVKLLIDKGANINDKDNGGYTSLIFASDKGYAAIVKLLIEKGANINDKDNDGNTALIFASQQGHEAIVKTLTDKEANTNEKDKSGRTALICASYYGYEAIVKILTNKGVNMDEKDKSGRTALICASNEGHEAVVKILIDKGVNISEKDNNGYTALMCASSNGHEAIVKRLIASGANINEKNNDGITALILASHEAVVKLLKSKGAI